MSHSHRRKTSRIEWFRMDVPKDIRHLAGKTSWQHSLDTTDAALADARRAFYAARYKAEVIRLRDLVASDVDSRAEGVVDQAFNKLAKYHGSIDRAVAAELDSLAWTVRASWGEKDAHEVERQLFGQEISDGSVAETSPIRAFDLDRDQELFKLRAQLFETRKDTAGLAYQELARLLLARGLIDQLPYQVGCMAHDSDKVDITSQAGSRAIARAYLKRLAAHEFTSWPKGIREALAPVANHPAVDRSPSDQAEATPANVSPASEKRTIYAAFDLWKGRKRIIGANKTADEFATVLRRFELLCGTAEVTAITRELVKQFVKLVAQLPYHPSKDIRTLAPVQQIAAAHEKGLPTLSAPTVGKQLAGLRAILSEAVEAGWIETNPAAGITVDGARWEGTERDHYSDDDMSLIYTSPLMTDPDACSDTMFWILFLAPFHGSRPGEHCKLKPEEIVRDGGEWLLRIRADRRRRKGDRDAPVTRPRRQKTASSIRDVPIHWIVEEGGFLDFVAFQRQRGAEWLFNDLTPDKYGDRYKYLSREINDRLRALGISDPDKSFYSTRHTMKREGRRQRIASQNLDQLSGHAGSVGDRYGQGVPADILKGDIDRLEFRSVPWDNVVACAKARVGRQNGRNY